MVANSAVLISRRSRASKLSPEKRREQLLRCGLKVFALRGIGSARHAEIAEEAGVAVPTVFSYFPTREVLVRDVLAEVDAFLTQALLSALDNGNSVFEKFLLVTRTFSESVTSAPDVIKIWLDWSTAMHDETWPQYEILQNKMVTRFADVIREGQSNGELHEAVNPEIAAYMVVSGGPMIAQMKLTKRSPEFIDEYLNTLVLGALMSDTDG